jgi:hypothetical protein
MNRTLAAKLLALVVACNYFAFRVELFEKEYEENNRPVSETCAFDSPTLNWETFDKDNAPKAFIFVPPIIFGLLAVLNASTPEHCVEHPTFQLVRDKSPPSPGTC